LPRGVVDTPSLEAFKARLDGALSNLKVSREVSLPVTGRLELDDLNDPLRPKSLYNSMIL